MLIKDDWLDNLSYTDGFILGFVFCSLMLVFMLWLFS